MIKNFKLYEGSQYSLGKEVKALFEEYGIGIGYIGEDSVIGSWELLLPHENNLKEFRIYLGKIVKKEDVIENWSSGDSETIEDIRTSIEIGEHHGDIQEILADFEKDISEIDTVPSNEKSRSTDAIFSIFKTKEWTGGEVFDKKNVNPDFEFYVWQQAAHYARNLKKSVNLLDRLCDTSEQALTNDTDEFIKFLKIYNINITTDTVVKAIDYSYRLYKDSKFFYNLNYDLMNDRSYNNLMLDFSNLV